MKKMLSLLLFSFILLIPIKTFADSLGSLNITLALDDYKVKGAEITIYKVADAKIVNNNLEYNYLDENFIDNELFNNIYFQKTNKISKLTNEDGIVNFNDLELGLYLVMQTNEIDNYSQIKPFLISIPNLEDNKLVYNVSGTPKVQMERLFDLTVKKEWNLLNKKDILKSIDVQLLKANQIVDTVTLSENNNWTYTWENISYSEEYTVKEVNKKDNFTVTYKKIDNVITITNSDKLVQTGIKSWLDYLICMIGIILIGIGVIIENSHEDK